MSKHAPGPWKVTSGLYGPNIESKDGYVLAFIINGEGSDYKANARLIAAAPRMYELLDEARKIVRDMPPDWNYQWDVLAMAIRNLLDEIDGQEDSHA